MTKTKTRGTCIPQLHVHSYGAGQTRRDMGGRSDHAEADAVCSCDFGGGGGMSTLLPRNLFLISSCSETHAMNEIVE